MVLSVLLKTRHSSELVQSNEHGGLCADLLWCSSLIEWQTPMASMGVAGDFDVIQGSEDF